MGELFALSTERTITSQQAWKFVTGLHHFRPLAGGIRVEKYIQTGNRWHLRATSQEHYMKKAELDLETVHLIIHGWLGVGLDE